MTAGADEAGAPCLRVALLWGRIGPYHLARASAGQRLIAQNGWGLALAEICSRDAYDWKTEALARPSWATTLFPGVDYAHLPASTIRVAVHEWLDSLCTDVVVINGWSVAEARAALDWVAARRSRRAVVMSETRHEDARRWAWKEFGKRWLLRRVHAGLVGGRVHADYLARLGVPRDRIFLGYNAVDNDYFRDSAAAHRSMGTQGRIGSGGPYFFACARLLERKNFDGLLRAYTIYRRRVGQHAWNLVISGTGAEEARLRRLCSDLGLDDVVFWMGFLQYEELPRWYAGAGAFIHPAKAEAWGLVVNEAAACSLPLLVARSVGAASELLQDGVNGYSFNAWCDSEIADAMCRVGELDGPALARFGAAACARVDDFGPRRFAQGLASAVGAALGAS